MLTVIFLFFYTSILFAGDFNDLYLDLVNFWTLGRHSIYINDLTRIGVPVFTNNSLDFYIDREGFFVVYDDVAGLSYLTRNGKFGYNYRGFLVNEDGFYVLSASKKYINEIDLNKEEFEKELIKN